MNPQLIKVYLQQETELTKLDTPHSMSCLKGLTKLTEGA